MEFRLSRNRFKLSVLGRFTSGLINVCYVYWSGTIDQIVNERTTMFHNLSLKVFLKSIVIFLIFNLN